MINKFILWCFRNLAGIGHILGFICAFFIIALSLYWIETAIQVQWKWLNFLKPILNNIVNVSKRILPLQLNEFIEKFNSDFIVSITLIIILMIVLKYLINVLQDIKSSYENLHVTYKLNAEKNLNKKLAKNISKEQEKISKYMVLINTKFKKKFSHEELNINIDEQNKLMNDFIFSKIETKYQSFNGGFLYYFDDFNKIDDVLTILFKIIKSSAPLDYAICIQIENDLDKIKKLADLENFGKIIMSADTVLRYKHNKAHRFGTSCVGVYQKNEGTFEIHEFQEIN